MSWCHRNSWLLWYRDEPAMYGFTQWRPWWPWGLFSQDSGDQRLPTLFRARSDKDLLHTSLCPWKNLTRWWSTSLTRSKHTIGSCGIYSCRDPCSGWASRATSSAWASSPGSCTIIFRGMDYPLSSTLMITPWPSSSSWGLDALCAVEISSKELLSCASAVSACTWTARADGHDNRNWCGGYAHCMSWVAISVSVLINMARSHLFTAW